MFIDDRVRAEERLRGLETKSIRTKLFKNVSKILNATLGIVNAVLRINKPTRRIPPETTKESKNLSA